MFPAFFASCAHVGRGVSSNSNFFAGRRLPTFMIFYSSGKPDEVPFINCYWIERFNREIEAAAWQNHRNNKKAMIDWQFKNEEARIKLKKLYPSINV